MTALPDPVVDRVLAPRGRRLLGVVMFASGAAALVLQISWHRIIALHAGVDLSSATTVVAAFLAGLGIGGLLGGRVADRVSPDGALVALAASLLGVAVSAWLSPVVLYDGYREVAGSIDSTAWTFAFNSLLLLVPTTLMGMSLPLVARAVTGRVEQAGPRLGRLYAVNTLGAGAGAVVGGWYLLGAVGFVDAVRLAALLEIAAAVVAVGLARRSIPWIRDRAPRVVAVTGALTVAVVIGAGAAVGSRTAADVPDALRPLAIALAVVVAAVVGREAFRGDPWVDAGHERSHAGDADVEQDDPTTLSREVAVNPTSPVWHWYLLYGTTGALVLGLELVFFRTIDGVMKANAYTFGHLLTLFLTLLALGGALGSRLVTRVSDVRRAFLLVQLGVGGSALGTYVVLAEVLPRGAAGRWLESDGFIGGFDLGSDFAVYAVVLPFVTMALPVFLAGMSFPFAQAAVSRDMPSLGRHTGRLLFSNLVGNVTGTLIAGFVLIDRFGTVGALTVLCVPLLALGVAGVVGDLPPSRGRLLAGVGVIVAAAALVAALPTNTRFWAVLNGVDEYELVLAEDRSCASAFERVGSDGYLLTLNATSQNSYPYDDFHVLIGLLPALAHPDPESALAVGLGIGSTSYALLSSGRALDVTTVELCGGNATLLRRMGDEGNHEFRRVVEHPDHHLVVGDGRRRLVSDATTYDVVVPDTVRPSTGGSGNLFSREFFELVSSRLPDDGLLSTWIPTNRTVNAVATTFPFVQAIEVGSYGSTFVLASRSPIDLDRATLLARFDRISPSAFSPDQRRSLRRLLADLDPECITDGQRAPRPSARDENRDLHPRDEYFLTNPLTPTSRVTRTCGP